MPQTGLSIILLSARTNLSAKNSKDGTYKSEFFKAESLILLIININFHVILFSGPLLTALLSKLDSMMQNSLPVNLILTGLLARLATYPQPLLRSFLLSHNLVFQPTVKSLLQVSKPYSDRIVG